MSFDKHELNIERRKINSSSLIEKPANIQFVGVYEFDEKQEWRFISADERAEQSGKIKKYKDK